MKISHIALIGLAVLFILAIARLDRLENRGPAHAFVMLPGQEPATIYMPGPRRPFDLEPLKPEAERPPPAVVLVHGFMADRRLMSVLARRLAMNGYAVLAIDVSGHGENPNPFIGGGVGSEDLREEVKRAVDYLRASALVDGSKIVVMGHSMGAGAALDYATHDSGLKGAVMISGGWQLGPERPKDALFIFAEHDPDMIRETSPVLAARIAGVAQVELGKTYGDLAQGNAVEAIQMPGLDHITIVYSAAAAATIVRWLDGTFGITRTGAIALSDPRQRAVGLAFVLFVLLLVPLGRVCGSIVADWGDERSGPRGWIGLLILGGALIAAMPLAAGDPASFVPVVIGDIQISWFAVAGLITLAVLVLSHTLELHRIREGAGAAFLAAAGAFAVAYACQVAMTVAFHHLSLSLERLIVMAVATGLLFPFWMAFEWLVRRGETAIATVWAVLGRILIVALMAVGVRLGLLPFFLTLILPIIALNFVMIEIFSVAAYSASRNLTLIATFESLWLGWLIAAASPITFML